MSSPRSVGGQGREGTRVVLREITATLHNSPPVQPAPPAPPPRKSGSSEAASPKASEHEVKVRFAREFADALAPAQQQPRSTRLSSVNACGWDSPRSVSSGYEVNADTSYRDHSIAGVDELIKACADIRLGAADGHDESFLTATDDTSLIGDAFSPTNVDKGVQGKGSEETADSAGASTANETRSAPEQRSQLVLDRAQVVLKRAQSPVDTARQPSVEKNQSVIDHGDRDRELVQRRQLGIDVDREPAQNSQSVIDGNTVPLDQSRPVVEQIQPSLDQTCPVVNEDQPLNEARPVVDEDQALNETRPVVGEDQPLDRTRSVEDENESLNHTHPIADENRSLNETHPTVDENRSLNHTHPIADENRSLNHTHPIADENRSLNETQPTVDENRSLNETRPMVDENQQLDQTRPLTDENQQLDQTRPLTDENQQLDQTRPSSDENHSLNETHALIDEDHSLDQTRPVIVEPQALNRTLPVANEPRLDETRSLPDEAHSPCETRPLTDPVRQPREPASVDRTRCVLNSPNAAENGRCVLDSTQDLCHRASSNGEPHHHGSSEPNSTQRSENGTSLRGDGEDSKASRDDSGNVSSGFVTCSAFPNSSAEGPLANGSLYRSANVSRENSVLASSHAPLRQVSESFEKIRAVSSVNVLSESGDFPSLPSISSSSSLANDSCRDARSHADAASDPVTSSSRSANGPAQRTTPTSPKQPSNACAEASSNYARNSAKAEGNAARENSSFERSSLVNAKVDEYGRNDAPAARNRSLNDTQEFAELLNDHRSSIIEETEPLDIVRQEQSSEECLDDTVVWHDGLASLETAEVNNYGEFKPQRQSTTLTLLDDPGQAEKLKLAAEEVADSIRKSAEDTAYHSAISEVFRDPTSFDFLLAQTSSLNSATSRLRTDSLYVKFDPLVTNTSMLPQGNTQLANEEVQNGKSEAPIECHVVGTPKKNPAIAAIDRLLFFSPVSTGKECKVEGPPEKKEEPVEEPKPDVTPIPDVSVYQKELELVRATVLQLEAELEKQRKEHERQVGKLQAQLAQEVKNNNQMTVVVEEYEKSISRLVAERERDRTSLEQEKAKLQEELQAANHHLTNTEAAFNDVHLKYERLKGVVSAYKNNETVLKESIQENVETIKTLEAKYDQLKSHAMSQLEKANSDLEVIRKQHEAEAVKHQAMLKKAELKNNLLTKENKELTQILDEVIARVGPPNAK